MSLEPELINWKRDKSGTIRRYRSHNCRYIPITLKTAGAGILSVTAWFRQLSNIVLLDCCVRLH
jgi:hypothetical protein